MKRESRIKKKKYVVLNLFRHLLFFMESQNTFPSYNRAGFTIIELLVVIGIISALFGLATINLVGTQHKANVSAAVDGLVSDLRVQQTKAMSGTQDTTGSANSYGITIKTNSYSLFQGTTDPNNSTDFVVSPTAITFSTTLPSNTLVFAQRSGEIGGGPYTITVQNAYGSEQKIITINRYGVVTSVQ